MVKKNQDVAAFCKSIGKVLSQDRQCYMERGTRKRSPSLYHLGKKLFEVLRSLLLVC